MNHFGSGQAGVPVIVSVERHGQGIDMLCPWQGGRLRKGAINKLPPHIGNV